MERYARMMAEHMHAQGRRAHIYQPVRQPVLAVCCAATCCAADSSTAGAAWSTRCIKSNYVRQKFIKLWLLNRGYPIWGRGMRASLAVVITYGWPGDDLGIALGIRADVSMRDHRLRRCVER